MARKRKAHDKKWKQKQSNNLNTKRKLQLTKLDQKQRNDNMNNTKFTNKIIQIHKDTWKECMDVNTGKTFWYNVRTKVSQWNTPVQIPEIQNIMNRNVKNGRYRNVKNGRYKTKRIVHQNKENIPPLL